MEKKRPYTQLFDYELMHKFRSKRDFYDFLTQNRKLFD